MLKKTVKDTHTRLLHLFFNKNFKKFKRRAEFQVIVYQWSAHLPKR